MRLEPSYLRSKASFNFHSIFAVCDAHNFGMDIPYRLGLKFTDSIIISYWFAMIRWKRVQINLFAACLALSDHNILGEIIRTKKC